MKTNMNSLNRANAKLNSVARRLLRYSLVIISLVFQTASFPIERGDLDNSKIQSLIGLQTVSGEFSGGWKTLEMTAYGDGKSYALLAKGRKKVLAVTTTATSIGVPRKRIANVVLLKGHPLPRDWHSLVTECTSVGAPKNAIRAPAQQIIVAEVIFKKCSRYSTKVPSAWLIDITLNTIRPWPSGGLRCGNSFLDSGEFSECKFVPKEF